MPTKLKKSVIARTLYSFVSGMMNPLPMSLRQPHSGISFSIPYLFLHPFTSFSFDSPLCSPKNLPVLQILPVVSLLPRTAFTDYHQDRFS